MRKPWLLLTFLFLAPSGVSAQPLDPGQTPRIGLVLGGGGARGFAHIGVLQVLEENRIPVHAVAGTSMGAVVGSLYAQGQSAPRITEIAREIPWATIFTDTIPRDRIPFRRKRDERDILVDFRISFDDRGLVLPKGVLRGQDLFLTLAEYLYPSRAVSDFDQLAIPFRAVAADIETGHAVTLGTGDIATAVFASMAVPGGLPPVERDGLLLVDGGIVDNVPIDVARGMAVNHLIVVDVGTPLQRREAITSFVSVLNQMQLLLGRENIERQVASLGPADILIRPDQPEVSTTSFTSAETGIAAGRAAAIAMLPKLRRHALSEADWAAHMAVRAARAPGAAPRVTSLALDNRSDTPDETIKVLITQKAGKPLDARKMTEDLQTIYALGTFRSVRYGVTQTDRELGEAIVIQAEGDPSAANFLQFGLGLATNFDRQSDIRIGLAYTDRNLAGTGMEWRTDLRIGTDLLIESSLYRERGRSFLEPALFVTRVDTGLYEGAQALAEIRNERIGGRIDGGWLFGNWGELRLGASYAAVGIETKIGEPQAPDSRFQDLTIGAAFTVDTLDQLVFPTEGVFAQLRVTDHLKILGGDFSYAVVDGVLFAPHTFGNTTINLGGEFGFTSEGDGRSIGDFRLGGFLRLSGLQPQQLIGRHKLIGRAIVYHRLGERAPIVDFPLYLGGSLELGNAWAGLSEIGFDTLRPAGSLFVSADTPLGPVTMAAGAARGGGAIYLIVGRIF